MNTIQIKNFGPVKKAEVDLEKKMQILIGAQASGKSTVCKVVYFCQKIRDYTLEFLMDREQYTENHQNEFFNNYLKCLTRQFMGCFGKTTHMQHFQIIYKFDGKQITIALNKDGYIRFQFSDSLKRGLNGLITEASELFRGKMNSEEINTVYDNIKLLVLMRQQFREHLYNLFANNADIIYIPAGRSLLATMSEQLQDFSYSEMDLTMQEFMNLINR